MAYGDFRRTYDFVCAFIGIHGYSPSHQEIRDGVGLSSTSVVAFHLSRLREQGLVSYMPHVARTVRPVAKVGAA